MILIRQLFYIFGFRLSCVASGYFHFYTLYLFYNILSDSTLKELVQVLVKIFSKFFFEILTVSSQDPSQILQRSLLELV